VLSTGVAAVVIAMVLVAFFWHRQQNQQAETLVNAMMIAPPESVPNAVDQLRRYGGRATSKLEAIFDSTVDPKPRLRAAVALASLGELGKAKQDFLIRSVSGSLNILEGECPNIVQALSSVKDSAADELLRRMEEEERIDIKVRYATVSLHLGDARPSRQLLALGTDPTDRVAFIHGYREWHGDLSEFPRMLRDNEESSFRSGLCAALGGISAQDLSADVKQELSETLAGLYEHASDGGTHSAAGWALRQWEFELPRIAPSKPPLEGRDWYVNDLGMRMLKINSGSFPRKTEGGKLQEVVLTRSFYLCNREVSVSLFQRFMNDSDVNTEKPDRPEHNKRFSATGEHPVQAVSWEDAVLFCNWLSCQEKLTPCFARANGTWICNVRATGYRLPTEAEWEYACRAGTTTEYSCGDDVSVLRSYAVFGASMTEKCGSKLPNAWGLFDIHGNVYEWCQDWYGVFGDAEQLEDPMGPRTGRSRVLRGGSFLSLARSLRSASRNGNRPAYRNLLVGFRVARTYP
jgi:formylglycine-generating enzyme required for sulfatase activity